MLAAFGHGDHETCSACFSGRYPVPLRVPDPQATLFPPEESLEAADAASDEAPAPAPAPRP